MSIDLGISFEDAEKEASFLIPDDDYQVTVRGFEDTTVQDTGRPMYRWNLEVTDPTKPEANGKFLAYFTPLPWQAPTGFETKGIGLLQNLAKATGRPWEGSNFDPTEYVNASCYAKVGQRTLDNGATVNNIKRLFAA